jgi:hypothetical protein
MQIIAATRLGPYEIVAPLGYSRQRDKLSEQLTLA